MKESQEVQDPKDQQPPQAGAAERLAHIPELFEIILLYLPEIDLIECQRVSKGVRAQINETIYLQKRLHMRPNDDKENDGAIELLPFRSLPGLSMSEPCIVEEKEEEVQGPLLATLGIRPCEFGSFLSEHEEIKKMMITQPPITEGTVLPSRKPG